MVATLAIHRRIHSGSQCHSANLEKRSTFKIISHENHFLAKEAFLNYKEYYSPATSQNSPNDVHGKCSSVNDSKIESVAFSIASSLRRI